MSGKWPTTRVLSSGLAPISAGARRIAWVDRGQCNGLSPQSWEWPMPFIDCAACGHQISVEAATCPHCGHPHLSEPTHPDEPRCHACQRLATNRCAHCGKLACVHHVSYVEVWHHRYATLELRCEACKKLALDERARNDLLMMLVTFCIVPLVLIAIAIADTTRKPPQRVSPPVDWRPPSSPRLEAPPQYLLSPRTDTRQQLLDELKNSTQYKSQPPPELAPSSPSLVPTR